MKNILMHLEGKMLLYKRCLIKIIFLKLKLFSKFYGIQDIDLYYFSKTNLKTAKSRKPSKIKVLIDAYLWDRRSHADGETESKKGEFGVKLVIL